MSPLICFETVEWHRPERVLRQFGLHQEIPPACAYEVQLHRVDARGRHQRDWATYHAPYIALWDTRLMSAKLIYVLSSFHMLFCAFNIHIHIKLIKFPLNLVL